MEGGCDGGGTIVEASEADGRAVYLLESDVGPSVSGEAVVVTKRGRGWVRLCGKEEGCCHDDAVLTAAIRSLRLGGCESDAGWSFPLAESCLDGDDNDAGLEV
jgi:hypothetical protein